MPTAVEDEMTIGELKRELRATQSQADYAIQAAGVEPVRRMGIVRIFRRADVSAVAREVERIRSKRAK